MYSHMQIPKIIVACRISYKSTSKNKLKNKQIKISSFDCMPTQDFPDKPF